mmetsp:Transcript_26009/g.72661  ORF Transcript_26009/g.72661 Transcript_26009/m.72661 type:complete len:218 (+) Transcript_26009:164-817(+)
MSPSSPARRCRTSLFLGLPMQSSCDVQSGWPRPRPPPPCAAPLPFFDGWGVHVDGRQPPRLFRPAFCPGAACAPAPPPKASKGLPSPLPPAVLRRFLAPPRQTWKYSRTTCSTNGQFPGGIPIFWMSTLGMQENGWPSPNGTTKRKNRSVTESNVSTDSAWSKETQARLTALSIHDLANASTFRSSWPGSCGPSTCWGFMLMRTSSRAGQYVRETAL